MFGSDWDSMVNTVPPRVHTFEWKEEPKKAVQSRPAPPCRPRTRVTLEKQLHELQARRIAAHPDKGGSHEEFLLANAEYEAAKKELEVCVS